MRLLFAIIICSFFQGCNESTEAKKEVLLYLSVRDQDYNIYSNDLNGIEKQLTTNPGFDYAPMWNETLESIIYYSYVNDSFLIANISLEGRQLEIETSGQQEFNLSPDGQKLIHQVGMGDYSALVLTNLKGNLIDTISDVQSYNGRAKWSWQSDQIAYISDRDGNNEIYFYNLESQSTTRVTNNSTFEKYLSWSPDGSGLAYTTQYYEDEKPDRNDVFVINLSTGSIKRITNNEYNDTELAWSPISDRIAFHSTRDGEDHIFIMESDGSNVVQVTTDSSYHGEPCWAWK